MSNPQNIVYIYTDGACKGNPGPGGWGAVLKYGNSVKEIKGSAKNTTNNIMELTAAVVALKQLQEPCEVVLTSDSQYLVKGMTEWMRRVLRLEEDLHSREVLVAAGYRQYLHGIRVQLTRKRRPMVSSFSSRAFESRLPPAQGAP